MHGNGIKSRPVSRFGGGQKAQPPGILIKTRSVKFFFFVVPDPFFGMFTNFEHLEKVGLF